MNNLNSTTGRNNSEGIADKILHDLQFEDRLLKLTMAQEFQQEFTRLQEELSENHKSEERERIFTEMQNLLDLQISLDHQLTFFEFAKKYRDSISDIIDKYVSGKSDLISDDNLPYVLGLYRTYVNTEFDEIIKELDGWDVDVFKIRKKLLSYQEFERWLYYHAYCLCYHHGLESPTSNEVNIMIGTRPYGDGSLYPQIDIQQIVSSNWNMHNKAYRDFYCAHANGQSKLSKRQPAIQNNELAVDKNNFISNIILNGKPTDKNCSHIGY
jgi:hypothetical protein